MPQLRIYEAREARDSFLPYGASELLEAAPGRRQGSWYVVAHTAAEAVEIARRAGIPCVDSPRQLRVWGRSTAAERLKAHGHLASHGEAIAHLERSSTPVAKFADGRWSVVGSFAYDPASREIVFRP